MKGIELIGITGGIGSGKSVVSGILRMRGYYVYDCDSRAKQLMENSESLVDELKKICGDEVYISGRSLNKSYLAERLFTDEVLRTAVNGCVHKAVREDVQACMQKLSRCDLHTLFCESAILTESGLADLCSAIWLVEADRQVRIERVMKRNGLNEDVVVARMESQNKELDLLSECKVQKHHIDNSGRKSLLNQIDRILIKQI